MKLGLGTVQFGMSYGITNTQGQVAFEQVIKILQEAHLNQIDLLDTAVAYGQSEEVLGKAFFHMGKPPFQIVSKLPKIEHETIDAQVIKELKHQFDLSLKRLAQGTISTLLLHDANDLLKPGGKLLFEFLQELKANNLIAKIGISVYYPDQIKRIIEKYKIDIVQLPMNLLDQRFLLSGCLGLLKECRIEVHARSVFLQGVLLAPKEKIPSFLRTLTPKIERLDRIAKEQTFSRLEMLLLCMQQTHLVDYIIVGISTLFEFKEILAAFNRISRDNVISLIDWQSFAEQNERLILPVHWKK